jgi:hypothetical protein
VLIDPRGVFVTLSHYCPTAADLLFDHAGPVEIVEGPLAVPEGEPEGLDARDVLPPLLTDGVLMDYEGYSAWEAHMVWVLTRDDNLTPELVLEVITEDAGTLQRWRPGTTSLAEAVRRLRDKKHPGLEKGADPSSVVIRRYLAARAFASWAAYQGNGLPAVVASLHLTLTTLQRHLAAPSELEAGPLTSTRLKQAIRQTDLELVHVADHDIATSRR